MPLSNCSEVKSLLHYDPDTGIFRWINRSGRYGRIPAGTIAGGISKAKNNGYCQIKVLGKFIKAHRLAWFYMTGEWPKGEIDHINRIRTDNRFCNLRVVSTQDNLKNKTTYKSNTSGQSGVTWHKRVKMWQARISVDTKRMHLGYYDDKEEAAKVYLDAKAKFHSLDKSTVKTDD